MGSIRYICDDRHLLRIDRLCPLGKILYFHSYNYDENDRLVSESLIGGLGEIVYEENSSVRSPYHLEICEYDAQHNLVKHTQDEIVRAYDYNHLNELAVEDSSEYYNYDFTGNLIQKGDFHFSYDENNQLIRAFSSEYEVTFTYDQDGLRTSKTVNGEVERYSYLGRNEIAKIDGDGNLKELRIPGLSPHQDIFRPIAIETRDAIYAPIHNIHGNITKLINISTEEVISLSLTDPFGRGLSQNAPTAWVFSGKHYDQETGLIYFGYRYYAPDLMRWLTPDPLLQTPDLYQYCLNNPFAYFDPDGRFAIALPLLNFAIGCGTVITSPIWVTGSIVAVAGAAVGYAGYKGVQYLNDSWDAKDRADFERQLADRGIYSDQIEKRGKKGGIDSSLPTLEELKDKSKWEDISHPNAKEKGHPEYKNKKTGEIVRHDIGRPGETGHEAHDHYHRPNPNTMGRHDRYLDAEGNPVSDGSEASHLYPPEWVWWN